MASVDRWKIRSSELVADCRVFRVRSDHCVRERDGVETDFFVIGSPDWVNIIATTASGEHVMIRQFRHGKQEVKLELPGGLIDPGEEPLPQLNASWKRKRGTRRPGGVSSA